MTGNSLTAAGVSRMDILVRHGVLVASTFRRVQSFGAIPIEEIVPKHTA